jgi:predicted anti-sigma-YlaC factor YlaD
MISCEQCQKKLVAILDNEGCDGDEELTNAHLKDCPACRAFRDDIVRIRKRFTSAAVPYSSKAAGKQFMQVVRADSLRRENRLDDDRSKHRPVLLRLPRAAWITGLAGLLLLIVSLLTCYSLANKVSDLKGRLQTSQQELTAVRQDMAVAQAAKQLEESSEKEQKAISALYFRMRELEERFDRYSSPRTTFLPAEQNARSGRSGDM